MTIHFTLNGQPIAYDGDPERPLLDYLRGEGNLISVKDGCAPQAACGACTVELNHKAVLACVTPMRKVAHGAVLTTDGLSTYEQALFAHAFVAKGGVQCGFCIPGIVMRAKVLLDQEPAPGRDDIAKALTPNLCRCTGYKKIIDAIEYVAVARRQEEEIPRPTSDGRVGRRHPKYDAFNLALGHHPYAADLKFEGMVYGALKFSDHPRARVVRLDTQAAAALPGVLRIFTAQDVPGARQVGLIKSDWPLMIAEGEITRYVGDVLAGVAALSEEVARQAVSLIKVEYEVLEPVTDRHAALRPASPLVHAGGNRLSTTSIQRGDVARAEAEAAYVTHGIYETQTIEHGFMEPEASVARPWRKGIELYSAGQGVYEDRVQIARLLNLPEAEVRVIQVSNGGGFGGKEDLSTQGHAALFAYHLQRPVMVRLNRDESIRMHPKRHPIWMDYSVGCDAQGRLTFVKARMVGDTGAYASVGMKVMERAAGHATGAYAVPNVDIEAVAVYTNNIPNGAMRGFGVNQATFALESCLDELCAQGGFDRWQFRYDNALTEGGVTATGQRLAGGVGLRATLEAVKEAFYAAPYAGLACGIKNTGIGNGMPDSAQVKLEVAAADRVIIYHGWTEMGQGVHTMAVQTFCQETGLAPDLVEVRVDTASETYSGMTTASRATSLVGNAVIAACRALKAELAVQPLSALIGRIYPGEWVCDWTTKPGAPVEEIVTHYSYSYATQLAILNAQGEIVKLVAAHDAGRVMNPTLFEGQIEGSLHMGLGYAISEDFIQVNGYPKSTRLRQCGILRAKEMPEMEVIGVETPDPYGPYGAKGVGEIGLVPTAAAVANALYQYDGVRRYRLPLTLPEKKRGVTVMATVEA